jgi:glycine betaine/choline ABC-type transport system substrate-binding protein
VLATLTTEDLTQLGVKVAVDQQDVADVAKAFLTAKGLLK